MRAARSGWSVLLVVAVLGATTTVAACGSCDVDCAPSPGRSEVARTELTAVDLRPDDRSVLFETRDGEQRLVRVTGRIEALDEGTTYLVPVSDGWSALPDPCDCGGPYITDLGGEVVDTAYFASIRSIDAMRAGAALVGIGVVVIAMWALVRRRRGLPL